MKLPKDDSSNVITQLRTYFSFFGIAEVLSTDGAPVFTSNEMKNFCKQWGVTQRISSAYFPTSNKRAEIAVKSAKRLIRDNTDSHGSLDTDKFCRALLIHRNTPDPTTNVSPAEIVYGRPIRDHIPKNSYLPRKEWTELAKRREQSFLKRHYLKVEDLSKKAKRLKPLTQGDHVYIQDQHGKTPII